MIMTSDISEITGAVRYPLPPTVFDKWGAQMDVYARFMNSLRHVAYSKVETKILSSIQSAAVLSNVSDADASLILVDLGLRAPRDAFPAGFLYLVDMAICRRAVGKQDLSPSVRDLVTLWRGQGRGAPETVDVPDAFVAAGQAGMLVNA